MIPFSDGTAAGRFPVVNVAWSMQISRCGCLAFFGKNVEDACGRIGYLVL